MLDKVREIIVEQLGVEVEIPDTEAEKIKTVQDVINYIEANKK